MVDLHADVSWASNIEKSPFFSRTFEDNIGDTLALHTSLQIILKQIKKAILRKYAEVRMFYANSNIFTMEYDQWADFTMKYDLIIVRLELYRI